jgi:PKD repeat protein
VAAWIGEGTQGVLTVQQVLVNGSTAGLGGVSSLTLASNSQIYATALGAFPNPGGLAALGVNLNAPPPSNVTVGYQAMSGLEVDTGSSTNLVNVMGTPAGTTLAVQTGSGSSTVNVKSTGGNATITGGAGSDTINLRSTVANIATTVNGLTGPNAVNVWATGTGDTTTITGDSQSQVLVNGDQLATDVTVSAGTGSPAARTLTFESAQAPTNPNPQPPSGTENVSGKGTVHYSNFAQVKLVAPPTATITLPASIQEGQALTLTAGANNGPAMYAWDVNDAGLFTAASGQSVTIPWSQLYALGVSQDSPTPYPVRLRVTNAPGQSEATASFLVTEATPTLTLGGSPTALAQTPYQLSLTAVDPGSDVPNRWTINWGDNTTTQVTGNSATASHSYQTNGVYTISATAVEADGTSFSGTNTVQVTVTSKPLAVPGGSYVIAEGGTLALDGSRSHDPGSAAALTYAWTIDGQSFTPANPSQPTLTWSALVNLLGSSAAAGPSTHTVGLTVSDGNGSGSATASLTINDTPPTVAVSGNPSVNEGSVYTLALSATGGGLGVDPIQGWTINWGDGTSDTVAGTATSATHTYAQGPNGYAISATATDKDGTYNANTVVVAVQDVPPALTITGPAAPVNEGSTFSITLGASGDPHPDPLTWTINWGDGTPLVLVAGSPDPATSTSASHAYSDNVLVHSITAQASDVNGTCDATDGNGHASLQVQQVILAPTNLTLSLDNSTITEGGSVTLTGRFRESTPSAQTVVITWGDNQRDTLQLGAGTVTFQATHQYLDDLPANAAYSVHMTVTNVNGDSTSAATSVTVQNAVPVIRNSDLSLDQASIPEGGTITLSGQFTDAGVLDAHTVTVNWGDNSSDSISLAAGTYNFHRAHRYLDNNPGNAPYTITVTVHDDMAASAVASTSVTVTSVNPTAVFQNSGPVYEGSPVTLSFTNTAADPGAPMVMIQGLPSSGQLSSDAHFQVSVNGATSVAVTVPASGTGSNGSLSDLVTGINNALSAAGLAGQVQAVVQGTQVAFQPVPGAGVTTLSIQTDPAYTAVSDPGFTYSYDLNNDGVFEVSGTSPTLTYLFPEEGTYTVHGRITDPDGGSADYTTTVTVIDPAVTPALGPTVSFTEGVDGGLRTVATFTDPGGPEALADYSASIDWGDGTSSAGVITLSSGVFTVRGDHIYPGEGVQTFRVTLHHDNAPAVTVFGTASVQDPAVQPTGGFQVTATEGMGSGLQTVATFTDPGGAEAPADYSATIAWGDGTSSAGVITLSNGVFTVQGDHTYAEEGSYPVTTTVSHDSAPAVTVTSTARVSDPAVTATGGFTVDAVEGVLSAVQAVATFTDPGGAEDPQHDYIATIAWGDGSSSAGVITLGNGVFTVSGSHTYAEEGTYTITTTVNHGGLFRTATSTATVADATPVATPITPPVSVLPGQAVALTAAFTDTGTQDTHTARFDWGDAAPGAHDVTAGTVTEANGSGSVAGTHAYAAPGVYTVTLTVTDTDGPTSAPVTFAVTVTQSAYLLNPSAGGALTVSGNGSLNVPGRLEVDSSSSSAISAGGNASITAARIDVVGGVRTTGNAAFHPAPHTGAPAVADPFAGLIAPSVTGTASSVNLAGNSALTIGPGIYSQIKVSGNASLTLQPGVYVIAGGGLAVTGNGSLSGSGVFLYNAGSNYPNSGGNFGGVTLGGNGTFNLTPPAVGQPYAGILLFQSRDNPRALSLGGNGVLGTRGTIYAPAAMVSLGGNGNLQSTLVVNTLTVSGNGGSTLVADGGDGTNAAPGELLAGDLALYVSDPTGSFSPDERARIDDAVTTFDALLAPYNVTITEVKSSDAANLVLDTGTTSPCGGQGDGVLGCYNGAGEITLIRGWNFYAGADPSAIGPDQYDFETLVFHELGHSLGLGGSSDPSSIMYESVPTGVVRRTPTAADLNVGETEGRPDALHAEALSGREPVAAAEAGTVPAPGRPDQSVGAVPGRPPAVRESGPVLPATPAGDPATEASPEAAGRLAVAGGAPADTPLTGSTAQAELPATAPVTAAAGPHPGTALLGTRDTQRPAAGNGNGPDAEDAPPLPVESEPADQTRRPADVPGAAPGRGGEPTDAARGLAAAPAAGDDRGAEEMSGPAAADWFARESVVIALLAAYLGAAGEEPESRKDQRNRGT